MNSRIIYRLFLTIIILTLIQLQSFSQFTVTAQIDEEIEGLCDPQNVFLLFDSFTTQTSAECPISKDELLQRLRDSLIFVQENPKHKDKCQVRVIINCKGEVVQVKMDNPSKSEELDKQILSVFNQLIEWKAGNWEGKKVDSIQHYSISIKKGMIEWR